MAEIFSTYLHKRVRYVSVTAQEYKKFLKKLKFEDVLARDYSDLYSLASEGLFDKKTADIFKIVKTKTKKFRKFCRRKPQIL